MRFGVIVHGGAGSPADLTEGCKKACEEAFAFLESGKGSLEAVIEAVRVLEDDGRFNAGSGSSLRLDGSTAEMDAAVMDSARNIGSVISVRGIRNPILAARAVIDSPHVALSGQGARAFAERRGLAPLTHSSSYAVERYQKLKDLVRSGRLGEINPRWRGFDIESLWNFDDTSFREVFPSDTVGAAAMDANGVFAVATSTGGAPPMLLGRVGDTPMIGCGFYAGLACAVATTGIGEEIIKAMLAKTVYDMVSAGEDPETACKKGVALFPPESTVGIIVLSREGVALASNTTMANYSLVKE